MDLGQAADSFGSTSASSSVGVAGASAVGPQGSGGRGGAIVALGASGANGTIGVSSAEAKAKYIICPFGPPIQLRPDGRRRRFHAGRDQLVLLEQIFRENKKPNAKERIEICKRVNMNPRSLQIWFQNRRAKEKKMEGAAGSASATGSGDGDQSPVTPSTPNPQLAGTSSDLHLSRQQSQQFQQNFSQQQQQQQQQPFSHISPNHTPSPASNPLILTTSISIGSWRRLSLTPQDLLCEILTSQGLLRWSVIESGFCFKMELPITAINDMSVHSVPENPTLSSLVLQINMPPSFFRQIQEDSTIQIGASPGFIPCSDFTEHLQATSVYCHILEGSHAEMERGFTMLQNFFNEKYFSAPAIVPQPMATQILDPRLQSQTNQFSTVATVRGGRPGMSGSGVGLAINTATAIQDPKMQQYYYNDSAPLANAASFSGFLGGPMSAVGSGPGGIGFSIPPPLPPLGTSTATSQQQQLQQKKEHQQQQQQHTNHPSKHLHGDLSSGLSGPNRMVAQTGILPPATATQFPFEMTDVLRLSAGVNQRGGAHQRSFSQNDASFLTSSHNGGAMNANVNESAPNTTDFFKQFKMQQI
ncbi:hypothetical protein BC830DRAFT_1162907 [Chytriomyces sp. MP71]|nr:hypothetical protein BC830DRAFT_1162907 [Chytriomyces sp. MP71]